MILMNTHNVSFYGEILKIINKLSWNTHLICFYVIVTSMAKPTKWPLRPAKTQISLGIHPVWSVFAVRTKKHSVLSYPLSTQADAQADQSLCWAGHTCHFVGFVMLQLKFDLCLQQRFHSNLLVQILSKPVLNKIYMFKKSWTQFCLSYFPLNFYNFNFFSFYHILQNLTQRKLTKPSQSRSALNKSNFYHVTITGILSNME